MTAFLVYATYVQKNDPDGTLWAAFYGTIAIATLIRISGKASAARAVMAGAAIAGIVWIQQHVREEFGGTKYVKIGNTTELAELLDQEVGRELGGLVLATTWAALEAIRGDQAHAKGMNLVYDLVPMLIAFTAATVAAIFPVWLQGRETAETCKDR